MKRARAALPLAQADAANKEADAAEADDSLLVKEEAHKVLTPTPGRSQSAFTEVEWLYRGILAGLTKASREADVAAKEAAQKPCSLVLSSLESVIHKVYEP